MSEIFKESTDLKVSMNHAIKITTYFRNANNKFFIAKLRDQQKDNYGKYYTLQSTLRKCTPLGTEHKCAFREGVHL